MLKRLINGNLKLGVERLSLRPDPNLSEIVNKIRLGNPVQNYSGPSIP